jgi:3-oxoacyl-[acyl-carrier protein] reductase
MNKNHTLIIGGTTSLSEPILENFINNNHAVTSTYHKTNPTSTSVNWLKLDCNSDVSISDFNSKCKKLPPFTNLIFVTGILPGKSIQEYSFEEINRVININFNSVTKIISSLENHFISNSQILLMSSISGQRGSFDPIYAASKAAIIGLGKSLSQVLSPRTRTNVIAPGLVEQSSMFNEMLPERKKYHEQNNPLNKLLNKDALAEIIYELTTEKWSHLNGAVIPVNGGAYV